MKKDRSLLFGLLAVSMKKVRPDKLSEVARRTQTNSQADLGNSLVEEGLLSVADREQLDSLVEMSLAEHEGDASATIQALGSDPEKLASVVDSIDDFYAAFEGDSAGPPPPSADSADDLGPVDSILGDFSEAESMVGDAPPPETMADEVPNLDSLLADSDDPARTRVTQSGNTGDRGSVGDIVNHDAPDSFFESIGSTGTHIMSPVQAAAEIDDSEIVPAVAEHEGRYDTVREFAKGGMGQITLVHDTHLGRDVALKQLLQQHIMPGTQAGAPTTAILTIPIIARFLQEARITGQLEHPSIIPVYELGYRADGSLYYTMKLVRGQSMHDFLKDAKTLNDRLPLLTHFLDMCQAISYAHSRGVIHRDLKPMNIMIGEFGETVVIDWGIAKVRGEDDIHAKGLEATVTAMRVSSAEATAKTMYGQTIGSPYFMPAEQAMGRTDLIDERSDIYSLGAVLYTILTGKMPYAGNNVREFMEKVGQIAPKPVRMLEPEVRPELEAICAKAMALVPENRYQSAKELTDEIQKYLSGGMVDAYSYNLTELIKKYYKKHKTVINIISAAAMLLLVGGIYSYISINAQKVIAERNEKEAITQKGIALEQEAIAKEQEALAVEEKIRAEAERDRAQQQLYYANIANTLSSIKENKLAKSRELLSECEPASLRQWEWGHLEAVAHADLMTLDRGGRLSAFNPDGTALIAGTKYGSVSLHDLSTGEQAHEFINRSGNNYAVAASVDGSRVAIRGNEAVVVWDVATKAELLRFDEPKASDIRHYMALSANGQYVAALNSDKVARVWNVDTGEEVFVVEDCPQPRGFGLFFSDDGALLLVTRQVFGDEGWERRYEVYEVPSGKVLGSKKLATDSALSIHGAAFSPDNTRLALGTDASLQILAVDGLKPMSELEGLRFYIPDNVVFSPDGQLIAAGDNDGNLILCDKEGKKLALLEKAHEDVVRNVRFSHDGKRIATVSDDRTARLWSVPELRPLQTYRGHGSSVFTVAFSHDDRQLATSEFDGQSKIWDLSSDLEFAPSELDGFRQVTYSPNGNVVAGTTKTQVIVWNATSGQRLYELAAHESAAKTITFNTAGTLVASIGQENEGEVLRIWDMESGTLKESFATQMPDSTSLEFINEDAELLVRSGNNLSRLNRADMTSTPLFSGDLASQVERKDNELFHQTNADGTQLLTSFKGEDGSYSTHLIGLSDGAVLASQQVTDANGLRAFFTPQADQILLTRADVSESTGGIASGSVALWNTAENTVSDYIAHDGESTIHKADIRSVEFSADGTQFSTGDKKGGIALWKLDGGTLNYQVALRGHTNTISVMAFSPNGVRLVSGSEDKSFKIWDTHTGRQVLTLNDAAVTASVVLPSPRQVAFSEDGLHLATITDPPVSPMILHAFSTDPTDYPEVVVEEESEGTPEEQSALQLEAQMEAYKRAYWKR